MFRYDKLTVKAQEALQEAQELAAQSGQQQIGELVHLLLALTARRIGVVPPCSPGWALPRMSWMPISRTQIAKLPKVSGSPSNT